MMFVESILAASLTYYARAFALGAVINLILGYWPAFPRIKAV